MSQFGWLSERLGNFLNLHQKEGVPSEKGGGVPTLAGNYADNKYTIPKVASFVGIC